MGLVTEVHMAVHLERRLTITDNVSASEVLRKGLEDLTDLCDVVVDKFTASRDEFNAAHPDGLQSS
jgi:DNA-directed RNA polymerase I and III subunit RPAC2